MIRVATVSPGPDTPAFRFRIEQHIKALRAHGVEVEQHVPLVPTFAAPRNPRLGPAWTTAKCATRIVPALRTRRADLAWLTRSMVPGRYTLERLTHPRRVLDVDDAIWLRRPAHDFSLRIARLCYGVIAGNAYIAEHYANAGVRTWVLPTAIDTGRWRPAAASRRERPFTVGWTGSSSTIKYLEALSGPLSEFLGSCDDARLLVISDRRPAIPSDRVEWRAWSPTIEATAIQEMDVGLMPLADDEWVRGKCALKMLQYMASGIPTIAQPVGVAAELLQRGVGVAASEGGEWTAAMASLHGQPLRRAELGRAARALAEAEYSVDVIAPRLATVFAEVLEARS